LVTITVTSANRATARARINGLVEDWAWVLMSPTLARRSVRLRAPLIRSRRTWVSPAQARAADGSMVVIPRVVAEEEHEAPARPAARATVSTNLSIEEMSAPRTGSLK
jgi:hypothetical protein